MRKIFTERHFVVVLFIIALVVFSFASEDARSLEARNLHATGKRFPANSPQVVDNNAATPSAARD